MMSKYITQKVRPANPHKRQVHDPQKHLLYAMERELVGSCINMHAGAEELNEYAQWVSRKWDVRPPVITPYESHLKIFGYSNDDGIFLNHCHHGDNFGVLSHEMAHWIQDVDRYADEQAHGPEFCAIYREILALSKLLPRDCFDVLAARYGIEVEDSGEWT